MPSLRLATAYVYDNDNQTKTKNMSTLREKILETIVRKSTLKQQIFDNTFSTFNDLKETLFEMASEIDDPNAFFPTKHESYYEHRRPISVSPLFFHQDTQACRR